jgi:hypothetical protein
MHAAISGRQRNGNSLAFLLTARKRRSALLFSGIAIVGLGVFFKPGLSIPERSCLQFGANLDKCIYPLPFQGGADLLPVRETLPTMTKGKSIGQVQRQRPLQLDRRT